MASSVKHTLIKAARSAVRNLGFDIVRWPESELGTDPMKDLVFFLGPKCRPMIIDVGGNTGQSVTAFKNAFPDSTVHSFEPSPDTFGVLSKTCEQYSHVYAYQRAVGSSGGEAELLENCNSDMSSLLPLGPAGWGSLRMKTKVDVVTLDEFAEESRIERIDILKSDTQGFELEVFKGAKRLLDNNAISLIYCEVIFSEMYRGLPPFWEIFAYLHLHGFYLATYYGPHFQNNLISWTDVLFINSDFQSRRLSGT